ncbi:carbohydrate-binding domain-containing protein [Cryobacterium sp. 1639]|uniref:carbohydrate-binding domain-containing protein n=1 Tax=Cryobacterium inferilacus TaxID=2866629 RepID=UPI001C72AE29|nr:carbohydrate-binding domain-containing protein [Cryobacterium sp. 1639]MBX0301548.1 carbohydrate-binding domain-containing protein [Cryobacterium sp. 1639]
MTESAQVPSGGPRRRGVTACTYRVLPFLVTAALLTGCTAVAADSTGTGATGSSASTGTAAVAIDESTTAAEVLAANQQTHDDAADAEWDDADVVSIELAGDTASVAGSADSGSDSDAVTVSGSTVTITAAGTYELSGTLDDGQIVVASAGEGTVRLILNGVEISNSTGAALVVTEADEAMIVLADGSSNALTDTDAYAEDADANAALYSAADLTITGTGALEVTGNGNDGISSTDGLVIDSGTITVTAVDDGIRGKDYLVLTGGTVTVTAGGDGLKSDNDEDVTRGYIALTGGTVDVTAAGDGMQAVTDVVLAGADVTVESGGGHTAQVTDDVSSKGVKSGVVTVIDGGTLVVDAADDALHSDGTVRVAAGEVSLATGDDGVHADTAVDVIGGTLTVTASYEGLESPAISIGGGTVSVTASDDGLNASSGSTTTETGAAAQGGGGGMDSDGGETITITGGTTVIDADGDGFDSNGSATMSGGTLVVNGPTNSGNGALDVNGTFTVSGGTLLAAGSAGMAVSPDTASEQTFVAIALDSSQAAGTVVQLVDGAGAVVMAFDSVKEFQSVVFSSDELVAGETYSVYVGGTASGEAATGTMGGGGAGGGGPR